MAVREEEFRAQLGWNDCLGRAAGRGGAAAVTAGGGRRLGRAGLGCVRAALCGADTAAVWVSEPEGGSGRLSLAKAGFPWPTYMSVLKRTYESLLLKKPTCITSTAGLLGQTGCTEGSGRSQACCSPGCIWRGTGRGWSWDSEEVSRGAERALLPAWLSVTQPSWDRVSPSGPRETGLMAHFF